MAPKDVKKSDVANLLHIYPIKTKHKPKYKPGDYVRLSGKNSVFRKGYKSQFSNEVYRIVKVDTRDPVTYNITDKDGKLIRGKIYEPELILYTI